MSHFANCSGFSDSQLTILTALRGGTSAVACAAATVLLIFTCACQSKLGFRDVRRERCLRVDFFALFGVSISYLIVLSLGVVYHLLPASSAGMWCAMLGFFNQMLSVAQITLLFINTNPIMDFLWSEVTRGREQACWCKKSWLVSCLMGTVIVLAALILISSFVPFITETYGEVCVWCWILTIDKDCKVLVAGFLEQIFLWIIYQTLISLICIVMILTAIILFLKVCAYKNRQQSYKYLFFKYIFQLIILVPIFTDFADVVFKPHTHHYSFILWLYYAMAPPISGFLIPFSFLLYIKFGNTGPRDNAQCLSENSPERVYNSCNIPSTADEKVDTVVTPSDVTVFDTCTAGENQTSVSGTTKDSTELEQERQSLLEDRWNLQYST